MTEQTKPIPEVRATRPDAQAFDEIRLVTHPRYKESELSGDEWRISAGVQFLRGGKVVHEMGGASKIETMIMMLGSKYFEAQERAGYFAGEGDLCDQEGCGNTWTHKFKRKASYDLDGSKTPIDESRYISTRCFCDRHKTRGDCGLDDADDNYELIWNR